MTRPDLPAATRIDGRSLRLTSLDKVMYPASGTTKQEVLGYYAAVAPYFVPHAAMRPATRKRFVDGVGYAGTPGKVFFEKNLANGAPSWIERRRMKHSDRAVTYPLINDASTLVWCAQMGALELHVPQWKFDGDDPANPDRLVLDLDPGPGVGLEACVEVALLCKEILDDVGLDSVPVTSGSKGIHLYAGLDGEQTSEQASQFAHTLARALEADHPDLIVSDMKKSLRGGKVLLDWSQNNAAKTTVAPYSLRGTPTPQVACPREWAEIAPGLRHLEMYEVIERLERIGDPMADLDDPAPGLDRPVAPAAPRAAKPVAAPETKRMSEPAAKPVATPATKRMSEPAAEPPGEASRATGTAGRSTQAPLRPMQASVGRLGQVSGDGWAYEVKWDGYRALAAVRDGAVTLTSRNGIDLTRSYPELQELGQLAGDDCVLDGEIVALDTSGRPSFQRLQDRPSSSSIRVQMMLFDVLDIGGASLLEQDYAARRTALEELVADGKYTHVPPPLDGPADEAMRRSGALRLEGIVAKRLDSPYRPGIRTSAWLKLKHQQTQEVVVVGWSPGQGNRSSTLGSLLVAVPDGNELVYAGKVGSGLSERALTETLKKLGKIERRTPQASGVPAADARGARWVSPVYVAEVSFAEWTSSGRLRQPVWKGWRPDKTPAQVFREEPAR